MTYRHIVSGAAALAASLAAFAAPALAIPYTDGLVLIVADKQFTFSSCTYSAFGPVAGVTGCGDLNVVPLITGTGSNKAWGFGLNGLIAATGAGGFADITLHYHVDVLDPNAYISDAHLAMTGSPTLAFVDETMIDGITPEGVLNATGLSPFDSINTFHLVKHLDVTKDYGVISLGGVVQISAVDQTFTQVGYNVPEPASLALFGSGLIGLAALRRRKRV